MKLNDTIQSAIWIDGTETKKQRARFELDVTNCITLVCDSEGFLPGPMRFTEKRPGDERVPAVPDHIQGERVRLLVGEADIVGKKPESKPDSFVANLDRKDLMRLRHLTRIAHSHNSKHGLTDSECDAVIEHCGPEAALDTLRRKDLQ